MRSTPPRARSRASRRARSALRWGLPPAVLGIVASFAAIRAGHRAPAPPEPFSLRTPSSPVVDPVRSEEIADAVGRAVKDTVLAGLRERSMTRVARGLTGDFLGELPIPREQDSIEGGAVRMWRTLGRPAQVHTRAASLSDLQGWLSDLAAVERADWHAFESLAQEGADAFVAQRAHFDVAGIDKDGRRIGLHATVRAEFAGEPWRLRRLSFDDASWTSVSLPPFADISGASGFDFAFSEPTRALTQALVDEQRVNTGGGLTALDFNRDGLWDILATQWNHETVLFTNDGVGGFSRSRLPLLSAPAAVSKFYAWVDLDDDGSEELVGTRVVRSRRGEAEIDLFTWRDGKMRRAPPLVFANPDALVVGDFEAITPCDVDGDGRLDLVFAGYAHAESKLRPPWDPDSGMRNLLFINQGGLHFREESQERGVRETHFSFVAECHDFDGDGDPDLFLGNDYGNDDYYENTGAGVFRLDPAHPLHAPSFSMGVSIADYDNTGRYAMSVSNMYSHAGQRIIPLAEGLSDEKRRALLAMVQGSSLFEREGVGWVDRGREHGVNVAGWAWGNVFFDFDDDGDKDLYVVNGYTSHTDPSLPDF